MSRNIIRQIKRCAARKDAQLRKHAVNYYGAEVSLADLHPEVKYALGLLFAAHKAWLAKDEPVMGRLMDLTSAYVARYQGQTHVVEPTVDAPEVTADGT